MSDRVGSSRERSLPTGYQFGDALCPPGAQRLFCSGCNAIVTARYEILEDRMYCRRGHIVEPTDCALPVRTDLLYAAHTAAYTPPVIGTEHGRPCKEFRPWPSDGVVTLSSNVCATCDFTKREHR